MLQNLGRMPEISVSSIIDILFVALVIYGFLKLLRWTHAMPALLGVALVALAVYWAHFKGLNTTDWLVSAVAPLSIFALIVVFAAEIRHSLVRLGRSFSMSRLGGRRVETYDDIVMAANLFANTQDRCADRYRAPGRSGKLHRQRRRDRRESFV